MASVTWQGLTGFVQTQVAALQAAANAVIDATKGSITLAWAQAVSGVALWLQAQVAQAIALTRFQTSYGADADSWGAQFGFERLPAVAATSTVTFGRFTPTVQAVVPAGTASSGTLSGGAVVSTGPGGVQFMVTVDTTNPLYSAAAGGYVLPPGTASATAPIQALVAGSSGNVLANTITSFVQPIIGIDTVANGAPVTNGVNAEVDPTYKARFPVWLAGLASSDEAAIEAAIQGVQQGLQYLIVQNVDYPGLGADNGNFFVIINDGSGSPPTSLLNLVSAAVQAVRGFTIRFQGAFAPSLVAPAIALNVRAAPGYTQGAIETLVQAAIVEAVNAVPLDSPTLFVAVIEAAAMSVPGCAGVQPGATTINGANADLPLTELQLPLIGTSNVSIGSY
jgi:hypothetical protein